MEQFVNEVTESQSGIRLKIALDMIWNMIAGYGQTPSMYEQEYFCQPSVKQYYNMLFLEGYHLLYVAYTMRGFEIDYLRDEERDRILGNNHIAWTLCSK